MLFLIIWRSLDSTAIWWALIPWFHFLNAWTSHQFESNDSQKEEKCVFDYFLQIIFCFHVKKFETRIPEESFFRVETTTSLILILLFSFLPFHFLMHLLSLSFGLIFGLLESTCCFMEILFKILIHFLMIKLLCFPLLLLKEILGFSLGSLCICFLCSFKCLLSLLL